MGVLPRQPEYSDRVTVYCVVNSRGVSGEALSPADPQFTKRGGGGGSGLSAGSGARLQR